MKKLLVLLLALIMCLTALTACDFNDILGYIVKPVEPEVEEPATSGIDDALAYLRQIYKDDYRSDDAEEDGKTSASYEVIGTIPIGEDRYTVTWTSSNEKVPVTKQENGLWLVKVDEYSETIEKYTLTATITSADGDTRTISYDRFVPKSLLTGLKITVVTQPVAGEEYYLMVNQEGLGQKLFFTGTTANTAYYFSTSEDYTAGVKVKVLAVDGGYNLQFGGDKYINIILTDTGYVNLAIQDTASTVFTWNTEYNTFVTTVGEKGDYYFGAYSTYTTLRASGIGYIKTSYPVQLVTVKGSLVLADGEYTLSAGDVHIGALAEDKNYGYPPKADTAAAYTIKNANGGVTIQDASGRYLYMKGTYNSFNLSKDVPAEGHIFSVTKNADGTYTFVNVLMSKTLAYSTSYGSCGAYENVSSDDYTIGFTVAKYVAPSGGDEGDEGETDTSKKIADIADANEWEDAKVQESFKWDENITVSASCTDPSSYGRNTGKYYINGENWRIYQAENPSVTITAKEGKVIVSVKITYDIKNTGVLTLNGDNVTSGTVVTVNASSITFSVGNTGTATNGQAQITAIDVVYEDAKEAECKHENTEWVVDKYATCTEAGSKHEKCKDCGETIGEAVAIPALGHDYGEDGKCTHEGCTYAKVQAWFLNVDNWETVCVYFFNNNGDVGAAWPGVACTNEEGTNWWTFEAKEVETLEGLKVIFNNNNNGKQTGDLAYSTSLLYWYNNGAYASKEAAEERYNADLNAGWSDLYLRGSMNSWGTSNRLALDDNENATITWTFSVGETFKIATSDDAWSTQFNASHIPENAKDWFGGEGDGNIAVLKAGKYTFTIKDGALEITHEHNYVATVTAPTCTKEGFTTHTCSICGDSYVDTEKTAALGHKWSDGEVTTEATCTKEGVKTFTCACGDTYTKEIEKVAHNYVDGKCTGCGAEKPTTLETKEYSYKCTEISNAFSSTTTATLGDFSWTFAGTNNKDGGSYFGKDSNDYGRGWQFGSSKASYKEFTLTSGSISNVSKIVINASTASSATATLSVYVGDTKIRTVDLTTTATDYTFELDEAITGTVTIKYEQPITTKALYIGAITITYAE